MQMAGVAREVRDAQAWPLNGLRHPVDGDACGWYFWAVAASDRAGMRGRLVRRGIAQRMKRLGVLREMLKVHGGGEWQWFDPS
ncbi:hypothetical protein [Kribbella sp. NPDC051620]|uniref:immunity protein Imm33 domain-containing protein n=1 Tax=Kribbella sp. NPDC051620 TaxID=3364120 RepID=UPI003799204B